MRLDLLRFTCLLLVAISMAGGLAHLFALPQKIDMTENEYFTVQQIYSGWILLGIPLFGGLFSTVWLATLLQRQRKAFGLTAIAGGLLASGLILFFGLTFPANQQTDNWTVVTSNWEQLRAQWEYSHAAHALLICAAFVCLVWQTVHAPKRSWNEFSIRTARDASFPIRML